MELWEEYEFMERELHRHRLLWMEMNLTCSLLAFSLMKPPRFQIYIVLLVKCQADENKSVHCCKALLVALKMKVKLNRI